MTPEYQQVTDEDLARQAQAGCLSSFEELVCRYEARIYRFVAKGCRAGADAQVVTQETFVAAHRHLGRFDTGRSFATWLFTIARRKSIDHHRSARTESADILPEATDGNDPAALLAQREAERDLWQFARAALPQTHFHALWLRYAEDMSVADIARILHRTRTHVKVILFRARARLARELPEANSGDRFRDAVANISPRSVASAVARPSIGRVAGVATTEV